MHANKNQVANSKWPLVIWLCCCCYLSVWERAQNSHQTWPSICWTGGKSVKSFNLVLIVVMGRFGSFGRWVKGWPHSWYLPNLLSWVLWHQFNTSSQWVPALQPVVCFLLCVGRKQDCNIIPTKTFQMHFCLSVCKRREWLLMSLYTVRNL